MHIKHNTVLKSTIVARWQDNGMERFFALHAVMRGAKGVGKPWVFQLPLEHGLIWYKGSLLF